MSGVLYSNCDISLLVSNTHSLSRTLLLVVTLAQGLLANVLFAVILKRFQPSLSVLKLLIFANIWIVPDGWYLPEKIMRRATES